jgi:hypothetical protein
MGSSLLATYPLALLQLMEGEEGSAENPPLGIATRVGVEKSVFAVPAHRLLQALMEHAPSPDTIAREFLVELGKCGIPSVETLGALLRSSTRADHAECVPKRKQ